MPPFCAPAPSYLLSDPPPAPEEEPENQEDDSRAQVIALLVDALNDAAAAAGQNDNTLDLANQAYTSLCYDFPIVSTSALGALHSSLKSNLSEAKKPLFPITRKFTAGLNYLVSLEHRKQATADGRTQDDGVTYESESFDVTDSETRSHHLLALSASVFLLAPALRVTIAHKDEGASLNEFFASYDAGTDFQDRQTLPESEYLLDDGLDSDSLSRPDEAHSDIEDSSDAAEIDDDDSDWEPLDVEPSVVNVAMVEEFDSLVEGVNGGWGSLMEKVVHLTSLVPNGVLNASVWEELHLTKHLLNALSGLRMLEKKDAGLDVITIGELYTGLLADHLVLGCSSSSIVSDLTTVISALLNLVEGSKDCKGKNVPPKAPSSSVQGKSWEFVFLTTLAKLCTKVGGFPICSNSTYNPTSAERKSTKESANVSITSPDFLRCLWQSTSSTLLFLQEQLDNSVRSAESFLQVELVLCILCFLVKYAPGNANLGSMLVGGGFFRTALSFFLKVGADPHMEVLRQFLLLSVATSSAAADYAAQMSTFRAACSSPEFATNSFTRPYAIIWPLLLQTSATSASIQSSKHTTSRGDTEYEAGRALVATLNGVVKLVEDDTRVYKQYGFLKELLEVHRILQLLAEATTSSTSGSFKLWKRGSFVDRAVSQCQVALGSVLVQETQRKSLPACDMQENDAKKSKSPKDSEDEEVGNSGPHCSSPDNEAAKVKRRVEQASTSEADIVASKIKETLPRMLLLLKQLSSLTKGSRGAKID